MRFLTTLLFAASSLVAQGVVIAPAIARPSLCIASSGGQLNAQTMPVGAMTSSGTFGSNLSFPTSSANAFTQWDTQISDLRAAFTISQEVSVGGSSTDYATNDFELLLQLSSPTPVPVMLTLGRYGAAMAGSPNPLLRVDVGDDGTPDLTESNNSPLYVQMMLGPQPLPVRVTMTAQVTGALGLAQQRLFFEVVPSYSFLIDRVMLGCEGLSLACSETFAGDLEFDAGFGSIPWPTVYVFGLGVQPALLPAGLAASPLCLLLPRPDALIFQLQPIPIRMSIPAAVRPLHLWAQAVVLMPNGLGTTDGLQLLAN